MALIICKAFVEKLPNKPTPFQALGEALYAFYDQRPGHPSPASIRSQRRKPLISELTLMIQRVAESRTGILLATEVDNRETSPHL